MTVNSEFVDSLHHKSWKLSCCVVREKWITGSDGHKIGGRRKYGNKAVEEEVGEMRERMNE
jgi:hypothetical protein